MLRAAMEESVLIQDALTLQLTTITLSLDAMMVHAHTIPLDVLTRLHATMIQTQRARTVYTQDVTTQMLVTTTHLLVVAMALASIMICAEFVVARAQTQAVWIPFRAITIQMRNVMMELVCMIVLGVQIL